MSGLIYEVAWVRSLELVFGTTTFAVATVLAAFMGGLALGSFMMGRVRWPAWHPLKIYAVIEVLIAVLALAIPWLLDAMVPLYRFVWKYTHDSFLLFSLIRFFLSGLVLMLPTILMGATLPLLSRFVGGDPRLGSGRIGLLYAGNTLGAVLGCAAAGFALFPLVGLTQTVWVAMGLNLLAALGAFALARGRDWKEQTRAPAVDRRPSAFQVLSSTQKRLLVGIFAFSGFSAMLYEVAWCRVLVLVLGSSTYAYTMMLVTFLLGLSLGAALASRWLVGAHPLLCAGFCQLWVALATYLSQYLVEELPFLYLKAYEAIDPAATGLLGIQFMLAAGLMLLPTLALGAMFPITIRGLQPAQESTSRVVGWAYALNTVGAIGGSVLTGFWLIPTLGSQSTLLVGVIINAALGLAALSWLPGFSITRYRIPLATSIVVFCAGAVWSNSPWSPAMLSSGVFRYAEDFVGMDRARFRETTERISGEVLLFEEGLTSTVTIFRNASSISLLVNGKPDASTPPDLADPLAVEPSEGLLDLPTQSMAGHIPLLLAPSPEQVLIIGLGSGVTLKSTLTHPIKRVECIELEDAVVRGSRLFSAFNNDPLEDARTELIVNDARNHLLVTDQTYDVVISEPSNPWIPGAANLFTREFFELCKQRLSEQGVLCQWVQLYELQPVHFAAILKTFTSAFPTVHLFRVDRDAILVGSRGQLPIGVDALQARWTGSVARDLAGIRIQTPADFLSHYWSGGNELVEAVKDSELNTDDNMLIEFAAPLQVLAETSKKSPAEYLPQGTGLSSDLELNGNDSAFWSDLAAACLARDHVARALEYGRRSALTGDTPLAARTRSTAQARLGDHEGAQATLRSALERFPSDLPLLVAQAEHHSRAEDWEQARQVSETVLAQASTDEQALYLLGRSLYYLQRPEESLAALEKIAGLAEKADRFRDLPFYLGSIYWVRHDYTRAAKYYTRYLRRDPTHIEARTQLADALYHLNRLPEARAQWQLLSRLSSARAGQLLTQAQTAWHGEDLRTASVRLDEARQLDPWNLDVLLPLARAEALQGRGSESVRLLKEYLEWNPDRSEAIGYLGELLTRLGERERGQLLLTRYHALTGKRWIPIDPN